MKKELTVPAVIESIPGVTAWIDEALEEAGCPVKAQMQIDVAVDEILGNIANYAYPDGPGTVTIQLDLLSQTGTTSTGSGDAAKLTFIDAGIPFDPLAKADPDTTLSAEERGIGGMGIFVVKKITDQVSYQFKDGKNILSFQKNF